MARKHMLANFAHPNTEAAQKSSEARTEYTKRGASRSMIQSLDEMAENTVRLLEGETIVSLDPASLDASFVADRIDDDRDDFALLRDAIRQSGQSTPILVRPHPDEPDRYMIVFGHRRARVARDLGIPVRAVIKPLEDIAHVIAQGQENTARADLTFIEKALFAKKLLLSSMTKETIKTALTIDDTLLSRMLSVAETVPEGVLDAVGAAKGVGRDRWEELKKLVQTNENSERAIAYVGSQGFQEAAGDTRFNLLLAELKAVKKLKRPAARAAGRSFGIGDNAISVTCREAGKTFTLALTAKEASKFGMFVSERLEALYQAFQDKEQLNTGD
ncbi:MULTISPECIES: plasmid partitioning protein RepB [Rhizobium]|uniref:plasmid partitioning protein RepB n=1 Tax=Rhizobium TaxID=379 RepID=UPI00143F4A3C|nr:plasmid partitioning protein RepB [Rhizobium leguminosarum]NKL24747.1 plasmid partitioning protein RepB [Rhizobium leguminosarum bv. viciae]NKL59942.1 plasmid partitioning protein RepB [Rhizobium leguminosarum bv. viciae]